MLNLLNSEQTRKADQFTAQSRGVTSLDLMESAAHAFVSIFKAQYSFRDLAVSVYCGTGNNGGDGLAIARLLKEQGYDRLSVRIARFSSAQTEDFSANLQRLKLTGIPVSEILPGDGFGVDESEIIIDALLGSGLNRPLDGEYRRLVKHLNGSGKAAVSVDVPTGFPSEGPIFQQSSILEADLVICFQRPKINFFMPESASYIRSFRFVDIGLDEDFIQDQQSGWKLLEPDDIRKILIPRASFTHKGTYGHALIIAGDVETMGAALLCADACVHSGAGLTTACIPLEGLGALNAAMPEVMALIRKAAEAGLKMELEKYQAIAIGPGLGRGEDEAGLVRYILNNSDCSLVLDADALNILSTHQDWISALPERTILTPHLKEFDRLFGTHETWYERVEKGKKIAVQQQLIIVLKSHYTFIILPDGVVLINPTGNPAMATGGMGDVLTGMIASFLAQGYQPEQAAISACYLHGRAGDLLNEKSGMYCIPPRYLIRKLPEVIGAFCST
jgi:ADP-dependent NAD(P)H-hydrate dehydratase / NAD(P)H-hydrate epimerase